MQTVVIGCFGTWKGFCTTSIRLKKPIKDKTARVILRKTFSRNKKVLRDWTSYVGVSASREGIAIAHSSKRDCCMTKPHFSPQMQGDWIGRILRWICRYKENVFCFFFANESKITKLVSLGMLRKVNLEITVLDYDRIGGSDPIGKVMLGYNRKKLEKKHWAEMVDNPRRPIIHWHVLQASATVKLILLLFNACISFQGP